MQTSLSDLSRFALLFHLMIFSKIYTYDNNTEYKLSNYIKPEHYNIQLDLNTIEKGYFDGTCYIFIRLGRAMKSISLHAQEPYIKVKESSIILNEINSLSTYKPIWFTYFTKSQVLTMDFTNELSHGFYVLKISFTTKLSKDEEGLLKTSYINKEGSKM